MSEITVCTACNARLATLEGERCVTCEQEHQLAAATTGIQEDLRTAEERIGHAIPDAPPAEPTLATRTIVKVCQLNSSGQYVVSGFHAAAVDVNAPLATSERVALIQATPKDHAAAVAILAVSGR